MNKIHLRIGSAADNQLIFESSDVAPYHLELFCDAEGNVFITDLGSEQGTYINNQRLDGFKLLKMGDRVRFGSSFFFSWEDHVRPVTPTTTSYIEPEEEEDAAAEENSTVETKDSNKQLYFIYGCIVLLLILMSLYL